MSVSSVMILNPWMTGHADALTALPPSEIAELSAPTPQTGYRTARTDGIARARRHFHLQLLERGADAWNRWSAALSALETERPAQGAAAMLAVAGHVDFGTEQFRGDLDLSGMVFPAGLALAGTSVLGDLYATAIEVRGTTSLIRACVAGACWIDQILLHGDLDARDLHVVGRVEARNGSYEGACDWGGTRYGQDIWYSGSRFHARTVFDGADFASDAGFSGCRFEGVSSFVGTRFGDTLGMEKCDFRDAADFSRATFERGVFFQEARFAQEPRIHGASFVRAPMLDGAIFPEVSTVSTDGGPALRTMARAG